MLLATETSVYTTLGLKVSVITYARSIALIKSVPTERLKKALDICSWLKASAADRGLASELRPHQLRPTLCR
jgi:hypothetical protein